MKIKDLKLQDKVEINGRLHEYRGINKIRIKGIGLVEKVVFSNSEIGDKQFDLKVLNAEIKEKYGQLIYKP
jgi:hypothetical protein